ncbi:MAG: hypothetical protein P1P89_09810 [Desulfobacterales bacterium]|nr:hypothetical protein [Desulfobacterales bacterium]
MMDDQERPFYPKTDQFILLPNIPTLQTMQALRFFNQLTIAAILILGTFYDRDYRL